MGNSVNTNTASIFHNNYSENMTKLGDENKITTGPGGIPITLTKDELLILAPSQEGLSSLDLLNLLTYDPKLPLSSFDPNNSKNQELSKALIQYGYTLFGMDAHTTVDEIFQKQGLSDDDEDELALVRNTLQENNESSSSSPRLEKTQISVEEDPITTYLNTLSQASNKSTLSEENKTLLTSLNSTQSDEIVQKLIEQSAITKNPDISQTDLKMLTDQFQKLGQMIADANKNGGNPLLNIGMSGVVLALFSQSLNINGNTSLTDHQKELLSTTLNSVAEKIAQANIEKLAYRQEPSQEYKQLTGSDPKSISALFNSFLNGVDLSKLSEEEKAALAAHINTLSDNIATKSYNSDIRAMLMSNDPEIVQKALQELLGDSSKLSPMVQSMLAKSILPAIAQKMGKINEEELQEMLKSDSPEELETAFGILSGVLTDTKIEPKAKKIVVDYMKALTEALVFMAQIRSLITKLEGAFTQAIAAAKLSVTSEQIKNAMSLFLNKCEEIQKKYVENAKKIAKAKLMKILMPIIAILLLLVAVVMIVVSLVGAVFTAGASAVVGLALVAKIIALVVALCVTVAVLVYTLVDAISTWSTGKGILERAFANEPNETKRKSLIMAVNLAITIGTAVLTFGVAIGSAIALSVVQSVNASLKAILQTALQLIKETMKQLMSGPIAAQMIGLVIGALFSSGFIQDVLIKMFKAMGMEDKAASIMTMVMMLLMMLAIMLTGSAGSMASGIKNVAAGAKVIANDVLESIKNILKQGFTATAKQILQKIKDMIKDFTTAIQKKLESLLNLKLFSGGKKAFDGIASTTKSAAQSAMDASMTAVEKVLKRLMDYVKNNIMMPENALKFMAAALQITTQAIAADTARTRADINKSLAALERESVALEAAVNFLHSVDAIGGKSTISSLNEASQKMFNDWKELCGLVAQFIMGMSQNMTIFHDKTR